MINVYAINLNQNGVINSNKVLIQDIPANNGIHIINPNVKIGIESSGNFSFSIQPDDEFYDQFMQLKTVIEVDYDGTNIFYGRVLTIENGFFGEQKIACEGAISFLLDSYYPPKVEKERTPILISKYLNEVIANHNSMIDPDETKKFYAGEVPGNYSLSIQADQKIADEEYAFGVSSWTQTKSILDDLKSYYGGCWRTRYALDTFPDIGQYGLGNIDLNNRPVVHNPDGSISTEISFGITIDNEEILLPTIINGQIYTEEAAIEHYIQSGEYLGKFSTSAEAEQYAIRLHERQDWYYNGEQYYRIYLDWLDQYFDSSINPQTIEVGRNLITAGTSTEVDNIFTRIIPIGKKDNKELYLKGYSVTTRTGETWTFGDNWFDIKDLTKVYTDEELSTGYHSVDDYTESQGRYGIIWKIVSFDDMDSQDKLFTAALKWAKDNFHGSIESVSVTAIDMHMTGSDITQISVGDRVILKFPFGRGIMPPVVTKLLTCLEIEYDLYNPENTSFRFGIPSMALTKNRRSSGNSTKKNSSSPGYKPPSDDSAETDDYDKWFNGVRKWLRQNKVWYNHNVPAQKQGGPTLRDSAGQTHPPYFWVFDPQMGSDGRGKILFWSPVVTGVDNQGHIIWGVDSQGRPRGSWLLREYSELTDTLLKNHHIYDYVIYEYGLDLRTGLSIKMPAVTTDEDGNVSIFSGIFSGEGGGGLIDSPVVKKIAEFLGVDQVLNIFNSDGLNIAKILGENGTYLFAELDDQGNVKVDEHGDPIYINIRDIHHSTIDLKNDLEATGHKVDLLDGDVTLIGQKVGDETYGLIKQVADQGNTIASISDDVTLIGQHVDQSISEMTTDLAAMDRTVTILSGDVTVIGQKVGDETSGLIKQVADQGNTITSISTDVTLIGQHVDQSLSQMTTDLAAMDRTVTLLNGDVTVIGQKVGDETSGLIKQVADQGNTISALSTDVVLIGENVDQSISKMTTDIAEMDHTVTVLSGDVTVIGQKVGDETSGLIKDLADMNKTVTDISSDVTIIGQTVGDSTKGLVKDLADMNQTVTVLSGDVTVIGQKVGDETSGLIKDLADMGTTVTNISTDVTIIGQKVGDNTKGLIKDLADTNATVAALSDDVILIGQTVGDSTKGLVKDLADMGITVTNISTDVTLIGQKVGDNTKGLIKDLADMGKTVTDISSDITIIGDDLTDAQTAIAQAGEDIIALNTASEGFQSSITELGNKIGLVVEGTGENAHIKPASIVASINNGSSSIVLSADHLELDGLVHASDLTTDWLKTKIETADMIHARALYVPNGSTGTGTTNWENVKNSIYDVKLVPNGNSYTLQKKTWLSDWVDIGTFSRAVSSWSGNWSGSVLSITASPQDQSGTVGFGTSYGSNTVDLQLTSDGDLTKSTSIPNCVDVPLKIQSLNPGSVAPTPRYTKTIPMFYAPLLETKEITGNGTYNTFSDGKIGYSSVTVNVAGGITGWSGNWTGSVLSITASPQNQSGTVGFGTPYGTNTVDVELVSNGGLTKSSTALCIDVPLKIQSLNGGSTAPTSRYTKTITMSYASLLESKSVTENGTYNTFSSGKIGYNSVTVNVSNAITGWSGNWTGSTLSITASPQNQSGTVGFGTSYGTNTVDLELVSNGGLSKSSTANCVDVKLKIQSLNSGSTAPTSRYTKTIPMSYASLLESKSVTANGTYNTFSDGKIGYNSVSVDITPTATISAASSKITVTISPKSVKKVAGFGSAYGTNDIDVDVFSNGTPTKYSATQIDVPVYVGKLNSGSTNPTSFYSKKIRYTISSLLESKSVTANGTYNTFSDGKIGYNSVSVDITPTATISAASSKITVTISPKSVKKVAGFGSAYGTNDIDVDVFSNGTPTKYSATQIDVPVYVGKLNSGSTNPTSFYSKKIRYTISSLLESKSVTANGTYNTFSDGKIGYNSVSVDITPTATISAASSKITVTISPKSVKKVAGFGSAYGTNDIDVDVFSNGTPTKYSATQIDVPVYVGKLNSGSTNPTSFYSKKIRYTISSLLESKSVTANGTYNTFSDGKIGYNSVSVDITPTATISAASSKITVTISPKSVKKVAGFGSAYGTNDIDVDVFSNGTPTKYSATQIDVPVYVGKLNSGSTSPTSFYSKKIRYTISSLLESKSVTANGTYNTFSDGKIGYNSVSVDITPTISNPTIGSNKISFTINPKSITKAIGFGSKYGTNYVDLEVVSNGGLSKSSTANSVDIPIKVQRLNSGSTAPTSVYTKTITMSYASLLESKSVTANGTYNTFSDGKIGYNSVSVDITPTATISAASSKITVTISPKSVKKVAGFGSAYGTNDIDVDVFSNGTPTKYSATQIDVPVYVGKLNSGSTNPTSFYSKKIRYTISSLLESKSVTANGTYNTFSDGKIGYNSVSVDITPTVNTPTAGSNKITFTINPKSITKTVGFGTAYGTNAIDVDVYTNGSATLTSTKVTIPVYVGRVNSGTASPTKIYSKSLSYTVDTTSIYNSGYDADHHMFLGDYNYGAMSSNIVVTPGTPIEVWTYFKKSDNKTYQWSPKYTITAIDNYNTGYDANHYMYIGDYDCVALSDNITVTPGSPMDVWAYFVKTDGSYQWSTKYTLTATNPHPTKFSLECTAKSKVNPQSTIYNYTFTTQTAYSFSVGSKYNFYM